MFSVYPIPSWWLREYIALSYYHHQIGSMNSYPLFRVRSWNNCMCCMSIYILIGYPLFTDMDMGIYPHASSEYHTWSLVLSVAKFPYPWKQTRDNTFIPGPKCACHILKCVCSFKVIHKEYSRFLNQFFPTPHLYHELNMIIYTSYINI